MLFRLAERGGFEPPDPRRSTVFKTAAIDHSAISPLQKYEKKSNSQVFHLQKTVKQLKTTDNERNIFFAKAFHARLPAS